MPSRLEMNGGHVSGYIHRGNLAGTRVILAAVATPVINTPRFWSQDELEAASCH